MMRHCEQHGGKFHVNFLNSRNREISIRWHQLVHNDGNMFSSKVDHHHGINKWEKLVKKNGH